MTVDGQEVVRVEHRAMDVVRHGILVTVDAGGCTSRSDVLDRASRMPCDRRCEPVTGDRLWCVIRPDPGPLTSPCRARRATGAVEGGRASSVAVL